MSHEAVRKRLKVCEKGSGVNPLGTPSGKPTEAREGHFRGYFQRLTICLREEFLETKGIELYWMQVEIEGYQVKHDGQVIRFYVKRKNRV